MRSFDTVIPAKAGIHFLANAKVKMGPRFRGDDGLQVCGDDGLQVCGDDGEAFARETFPARYAPNLTCP
jgi:hypothetical protein